MDWFLKLSNRPFSAGLRLYTVEISGVTATINEIKIIDVNLEHGSIKSFHYIYTVKPSGILVWDRDDIDENVSFHISLNEARLYCDSLGKNFNAYI